MKCSLLDFLAGAYVALDLRASEAKPFPYPPGLPNKPTGAAFYASPDPDQPFFINFFVLGDCDGVPNAQAVTLRIWSRSNSAGDSDNGIEGFSARGPFASATGVKAGAVLLKTAGFGKASCAGQPQDYYAINESVRCIAMADEDFTCSNIIDYPDGKGCDIAATKAGGAYVVMTSDRGKNNLAHRFSGDSDGNFLFGRGWKPSVNNLPSKGMMWLWEADALPTASVPGAYALGISGGNLVMRGPTDATHFGLGQPNCQVSLSANIPFTGSTTIPFDTKEDDTQGSFDPASHSIIVKRAGRYRVNVQSQIIGTSALGAYVQVGVKLNGVIQRANPVPCPAPLSATTIGTPTLAGLHLRCVVGDVISGCVDGSATGMSMGAITTFMSIEWMGP